MIILPIIRLWRHTVKVLVLGSGGREHALAYALSKSSTVSRVYWTPGNAATEEVADNPRIAVDDFTALLSFAKKEKIDITVVGPEVPLVNGIADLFYENDLQVFGPASDGARIEGSKIFAKKLMEQRAIPTARFREFFDEKSALSYIQREKPPYVIKADGLAAGKGVVVAHSEEEAEQTLTDMFERKVFGESGSRVVIEEFLDGEEATVLALCDGQTVVPLLSSQDHKPVYDGDRGPNTGGMGAIAPAPVVNQVVMGRVIDRILLPLVDEFKNRKIDYRGVIYAGLMIRDDNPYVVEFNCRFGDPEIEALIPLWESDIMEALLCTVNGDLSHCTIEWKKGYGCDVVMASGGYPGHYEKGKEIHGIENACTRDGIYVFHAGTSRSNGRVVTNGGRVLNVVSTGNTLRDAVSGSYGAVSEIRFEGAYYRKDIGFRGLNYVSR